MGRVHGPGTTPPPLPVADWLMLDRSSQETTSHPQSVLCHKTKGMDQIYLKQWRAEYKIRVEERQPGNSSAGQSGKGTESSRKDHKLQIQFSRHDYGPEVHTKPS